MWQVFCPADVLGSRNQQLKFLGIAGTLTAACCHNCVEPNFNRFTPGGSVDLSLKKMGCYIRPEVLVHSRKCWSV